METVPGRTERASGSSRDRKVRTLNAETNAGPIPSVMFSCLLLGQGIRGLLGQGSLFLSGTGCGFTNN